LKALHFFAMADQTWRNVFKTVFSNLPQISRHFPFSSASYIPVNILWSGLFDTLKNWAASSADIFFIPPKFISCHREPRQRIHIATMLLAARSGDRIRVGIREFYLLPNVQAGCGAYPMDRGLSPGLMRPRREVTTHSHLLQRLRMSGAIPLLPSRHPPSICHSQDFYLWILALW
jgi:hypothetical protein